VGTTFHVEIPLTGEKKEHAAASAGSPG